MSDDPKRSMPKAMQALLKRANVAIKPEFSPGSTISRFLILAEVGKGGHGIVYKATDTSTGQTVAIKVLHPHILNDELKLRMKREAYAMQQLAGTSAAAMYECTESPGGQLYLVMEFLEGRDLSGLIEGYESQGHKVPIPVMVQVLAPIVETLQFAHERGIIHRDLKPENIFVLNAGGVRLVDFGLVKDLNLARLTEAGTVAGSPAYIAPEGWAGRPDQIDHRVDVYALGVIVFRILTGVRPFEPGENLMDFILTVSKSPRPSLRKLAPHLHGSIDDWATRALAIRPEDRYPTVVDLWRGLVNVLAKHSVR
ncbi:MAG: serine/threonine-protein kinase [Polyangiaceae bacterium]